MRSIFLSLVVSFFSLQSFAVTANYVQNGIEGLYQLSGVHSKNGPYDGLLEVRHWPDDSYRIVRVVTYRNLKFENLRVQEVWTARAYLNENVLSIDYSLKQADFITQLNGESRKPIQFQTPYKFAVDLHMGQGPLQIRFYDHQGQTYSESIGKSYDLFPKTLWEDERVHWDARGEGIPLVVRALMNIANNIVGFDKDPYVLSFKDREEFKKETPYVIHDPTDFKFYRNNPDILRLTNKTTDAISMVESIGRRNAYSKTLDEKAQYFEQNFIERHLNSAGLITTAVVDDNGSVVGQEIDGDGGLWTGMYAGSQAMRYLVTGDPQAMANFRRALKGIFLLLDIVPEQGEFARTVMVDDGRKFEGNWQKGQGPYAGYYWMRGGNNDMLRGITHAMMWATKIIPESDTEIWNQLREKSKRLIGLKVLEDKPHNKPTIWGLAAVINKDPKYLEEYVDSYKSLRVKLSGYSFDVSFYWQGTADWSGVNLGLVGDITEISIAEMLGQDEIRNRLRERQMEAWMTYYPAKRTLNALVTYAFTYRHGTRGDKYREAKEADRMWETSMDMAQWGLRSIPAPRPRYNISIDHSQKPEWCLSPIPRMFWKAANKEKPTSQFFYQGLYSYPAFEMAAYNSNMLWKDGVFAYTGGHNASIEYSGVDYLFAYWIMKYSGLNWN